MRTHTLSELQVYVRQGSTSLALASILAISGVGSIFVGALGQQPSPPKPRAQAATVSRTAGKSASPAPSLEPSRPTSISIPAISISSELIPVGKNPDGSIEVPHGNTYDNPAWYKYGPTPGEAGSSVIIGHVDSAKTGPSIFYNLGKLIPGDEIVVARTNGSTARFKVSAVQEYTKASFPSEQVYGTTRESTLKLITCSGDFDTANGTYESNIVVFATLVAP